MSTSAVVYLRISEDRTGEEAGVTRQREDCERRCRDRGWEVLAVESDNDASAAGRKKRPGFETLLAHIAEGRVRFVVAWALDRLQRNRRDEVRLYELCERMGVTVSLVRGPDLEWATPTGRYLADNLGSLARLEIEQKADRQARAQLQAAQKGERVGGRRPFGYSADGKDLEPREAEAVRAGYAAVLAGASLASVAREWNGAGLTTGQGGVWRHDNVRAVLRNPRNAGLRAHRRELVLGADGDPVRAAWPAVVPEETWRAADALLRDPERRTGPRSAKALLTGIARCGACGLTVHAGGGNRRDVRAYRCPSNRHVARMAEPVEEYVTRVVLGRFAMPDAADLLVDDDRPDVGELRAEAQGLRSRLDGFAADYADGLLDRRAYKLATDRVKARVADVEARLADAGRVSVLGPLIAAQDAAAVWGELDNDRRRAVIDTLMTVTLHAPGRGTRTFRPETVGILWN